MVGACGRLVGMGVGGEWAVGAALVAEVFPKHARERASGIFHATSVMGLWLVAPVLIWLSAWMKSTFDLRIAMASLGSFFLLGLVMLVFLPETKDQPLPD
jgi:MFS-type transporter involved in bile tolerance (Atg22 family)